MVSNILNSIAETLTKLENNPDLVTTNPKVYSKAGIILETYAKLNKLSSSKVRTLVSGSTFFKLNKTKIKTGLFKKTDKSVSIIQWANPDELKESYHKEPKSAFEEAATSKILIQKLLSIINLEHSTIVSDELEPEEKLDFEYLQEDAQSLYEHYFPEELEKYKREGRHESDLEKKFKKRVPKGSEFRFGDGKIAYNLMTWVQCLQMTSNDVVAYHIKNDEFYNWLEDVLKVPELARICMVLKKNLEDRGLEEKQVRFELLRNLNKTSLNKIIFETQVAPLIKILKSDDQSKVLDAIDRLIITGDERVVESLMEKVFDSSPQVRRKIIIGLGKLGDKRATPVLLKILKHSTDLEDKLLAVKTLGALKDKRSLKVLKGLAKKVDEVGIEAGKVIKAFE